MSLQPRIKIKLTDYQMRKLRPIKKMIKEQRGGVIGQAYLAENLNEKFGTASFCFMGVREFEILNPAVIKARELKP